MKAFWIEFEDRGAGGVYVEDEAAARALGDALGKVSRVRRTGYPASPRLDGEVGCPSFCIAPTRCASRNGSCANPYGRSCTS